MLRAILFAIVLGVAFTPVVFSLLENFALTQYPFSRVFDRVFLVGLIGGLYYWRRSINISIPAIKPLVVVKYALLSLLLGLSGFYCLVYRGDYGYVYHDGFERYGKLALLVPSGLIIGFFEEILFRAYLLRSVVDRLGKWGTFVHAVIFAACHFITPVKGFAYKEFYPSAGIDYLYTVFRNIDLFTLSFLGMFLVGFFLNVVYLRFKSISICIGIHCGWVWLIKLTKYLYSNQHSDRYYLVSLWPTWVAMATSIAGVLILESYVRGESIKAKKSSKV